MRPAKPRFTLPLVFLLPLFLSVFLSALMLPVEQLYADEPVAAEPVADEPVQMIYLPAIQYETLQPIIGEESLVGYATAADRTLIRWYWNSPTPPDAFRVYRQVGQEPETLVAEVTAVTDGAAAIQILNNTAAAWPDLAAELITRLAGLGVTDIATLQDLLQEDRFIAQQLANEFYPVALIIGWGYLDTDIEAGIETTYRVDVVVQGGEVAPLDSVQLMPGQITPLTKPTGLNAVDMQPGSSQHALPRDDEWAAVQRNRRFHQTVYLHWDQNSEFESPHGAWVTGYDLYRDAGDSDFQRISPPKPFAQCPPHNRLARRPMQPPPPPMRRSTSTRSGSGWIISADSPRFPLKSAM